MKVWMIVIRADDGFTWLEDAWSDDSTTDNDVGWREAIEKARGTAKANGGEMRVVPVTVPGLYEVFDQKPLVGEIES